MLCVPQPLGTLSCWGLQKADQELKPCNFQQANWDSRLFISRHAVVWNKGVRGGGNLAGAACPVSDQVSLSQLRGQTQRERQDVQKGKCDCATWGSALGASHLPSFFLVSGSLHFFLVDTFCKYLGVAQSCFDREELWAASLQQSTMSAGQRWQEAAASQNVARSQQKVQWD